MADLVSSKFPEHGLFYIPQLCVYYLMSKESG
jgi:hypothetical protein